MRKAPVFGNAPGFKPMGMAPVFGEPVYEIIIQTDARGLMKTAITRYPMGNPPSQGQMIGILLDCLQGQYQGMMQAESMLIDPNKTPSHPIHHFIPCTDNDLICQICGSHKGNHGGQEKENHNGGRGTSGE